MGDKTELSQNKVMGGILIPALEGWLSDELMVFDEEIGHKRACNLSD